MKHLLVITIVTLTLLLALSTALAQTDDYELLSFTISSGGGQSSGGEYTLTASIAQPDVEKMSGGGYEMSGGFQSSASIVYQPVYLPVILHD